MTMPFQDNGIALAVSKSNIYILFFTAPGQKFRLSGSKKYMQMLLEQNNV